MTGPLLAGQPLKNAQHWREIATLFYSKWNIPNNIGAIDRKRILIQKHPNAGPHFHDYKGNESVIALIMSGPSYMSIIPIVSVIEQLVKVQDKISPEILDIASLIKTATDSVAILGAANFGINMQRRDNIKPERNADYKHLCSPTVPFTDFLFGDDPDLSKQLKDLAEATKVSKKISKNSDSRRELYRGQIYNKSYKNTKGKKFGYKYPNQSLNSKRPNFSSHKKEEGKKHK